MKQSNEAVTAFMTIPEIHGVFADAILTDEADNLVFGSFWGRDTAIREFQGRLTLGQAEGGMTTFNVHQEALDRRLNKVFVRIGNIDALEQMTGRVHTDILGDMVHCWLYQRDIIKPDMANHRAVLIDQGHQQPEHLWGAIKAICPIPLLDHWDKVLIPIMNSAGMIKSLTGIHQNGVQINIDEDQMSLIVKQECQGGRLSIDPAEMVIN